MYARRFGTDTLTFDFAAGLIDDNLVLVDRETLSVWSQLAGKAISGPMRDTPLRVVPSIQSTWGFWKREHPETRVMVVPDQEGQPYYYQVFTPGQQRDGTSHDIATLGLGLAVENEALFLPLRELERVPTPVEVELGADKIKVHYAEDGVTAWAENRYGELMPGVLAYEDGWLEFFPSSKLFEDGEVR